MALRVDGVAQMVQYLPRKPRGSEIKPQYCQKKKKKEEEEEKEMGDKTWPCNSLLLLLSKGRVCVSSLTLGSVTFDQ
jgi:hypothetical protein